MKKSRIQFLYALLAFLAAEAIQLFVVMCYQIIYGVILGIKIGIENASKGGYDPATMVNSIEDAMSQSVIYLISAIAVMFCGIAFFFWYRYEIKGEVRVNFRRTFSIKNILLLILLGIGCQFFITGVMSLTEQYFTKLYEDYANQIDNLTGGNTIVVLCLLVFIAPITEELIFRGIILRKASRALPFIGANLLQAMLFGIYHMNIIQGIYAAVLGFILGLVCHKFKTIIASMLLHMIINSSSFLLYFLPENKLSTLIIAAVGAVATMGSLAVILQLRETVRTETSQ